MGSKSRRVGGSSGSAPSSMEREDRRSMFLVQIRISDAWGNQ